MLEGGVHWVQFRRWSRVGTGISSTLHRKPIPSSEPANRGLHIGRNFCFRRGDAVEVAHNAHGCAFSFSFFPPSPYPPFWRAIEPCSLVLKPETDDDRPLEHRFLRPSVVKWENLGVVQCVGSFWWFQGVVYRNGTKSVVIASLHKLGGFRCGVVLLENCLL